jgi:sec-independent protein translocase protein TatC
MEWLNEAQQAFDTNIGSHLHELRQRVLWVAMTLAVGVCVGFYYSNTLVEGFKHFAPAHTQFLLLSPTDGMMIGMNMALLSGILFTLPMLLWQSCRFLMPGLRPNEQRWLLFALMLCFFLFAAGMAVAGVYLLPMTLKLLLQWNLPLGDTQLTLQSYINFCLGFVLSIGALACTPLIVWSLGLARLLSATQWVRYWREILVGSVIIAAAISPSQDALTLVWLSLLLGGLYALSWLGLLVIDWSQQSNT